jgi:L-threonylcarbamoyladenylate synthase
MLSTVEDAELKKSLDVLKKGGIILYPTDTVWGIGCDATNDAAIERITDLKKRSTNKSFIILLDDEGKLVRYVKEVPDQAFTLIEYAERPLTIIYDKGVNVSSKAIAADGSVAIRVTKDKFCKQLIYRLQRPLISTSANISGSEAPAAFSDIDAEVLNGVDYVINLRRNEKAKAKPSTILKLESNGRIRFIRK